ncbi:MAG: Hpt domain-containing protein [Pseudolabrys sp.]|nr:Hpt domain-containing protein [Pseudolabrys sp.]
MPPKETAAVATYADHEVITPQNKLRKAVSDKPLMPGEDPVARAEQALAELSSEFSTWMEAECERLDKARHVVKAKGFLKANKEALFHAAHDIKGEAATFGYPAVAAAADSLCRLIEYTPDSNRIPHTLVDQHVDAVRAIIREYARSDAVELATSLTKRLREVTDEFLLHENRGNAEALASIVGPSLVPDVPA